MLQRHKTNLCSGKTQDGLSSSPSGTLTFGRCTSKHRRHSGRWRKWVSVFIVAGNACYSGVSPAVFRGKESVISLEAKVNEVSLAKCIFRRIQTLQYVSLR